MSQPGSQIAASKTRASDDLQAAVETLARPRDKFAMVDDTDPVVVAAPVPAVGRREFAVRPRGSWHLYPLRYVAPEDWQPPRQVGCPIVYTLSVDELRVWPEPGPDYEVVELVAMKL